MSLHLRRLRATTAPCALIIALAAAPDNARAAPEATPLQLPALAIEAAEGGYQVTNSALRKLNAPLLDTPQTVSTVSRQLMDDQGATTMRDALRNVPGISIAAGEFGAQGDNLTIRGFTARNDIYLDGMRDFGSYYRDPFYLDGIEVLKGPSSILFGRGSTGGIVEQNSKRATLDPLTAGTLGFGTDGTKRITADVDRPLSDTAAIRLNVMGQDGGVAGRDEAENSRIGFAGSLALGLGTPTRFTFDYLHQSEYDVPDYGLPWIYQPTGGATGLAHPAPLDATSGNFYGFKNSDFLRTNVDIITAKIEHDLNDKVLLTNQLRFGHYVRQFRITEPLIFTSASANTPGASGVPLLVSAATPLSAVNVSRNQLFGTSLETSLDDQFDATAKFATGFIAHTLVGGIELGRETSDPVRNATIGPYSQTPLLSPNPDQTYNANTYLASRTETTAYTQAAYFMDTLEFDKHWQLIGGMRFDRFDAHYGQQAFSNPITGKGAATVSLNHVDEMPSWRAALVYKPVPEGTIYAGGGTSFNPSAESLSYSATTAVLDPEKSETYEIGTKWELFDDRLALDGALYHTEKTNLREADPNNSALNILAGSAVAKGLELQVAGKLTRAWEVSTGYAYTFSAIEKSPAIGVTSDLGHRLANVPMHTANFWTSYRFASGLQIGGGGNYVSSRFASTTPTVVGGVPFWKQAKGYWTLNAMAKYPLTPRLNLQANLYNLTDEKYYDQLHPSHVVPGPRLSAFFSVAYRY